MLECMALLLTTVLIGHDLWLVVDSVCDRAVGVTKGNTNGDTLASPSLGLSTVLGHLNGIEGSKVSGGWSEKGLKGSGKVRSSDYENVVVVELAFRCKSSRNFWPGQLEISGGTLAVRLGTPGAFPPTPPRWKSR